MKRAICTFFALACCTCGGASPFAFPPAVIPPQPTASDWPDAGAVILDDSAVLDYRFSKGAPIAVLEHRRRMKILTKSGIEQGVIELPVDAYSTVTRVDAQAVSPSGEVTKFHRGDLEIVPWPGLGEAGDLKLLRVRVPGVEVGGLVDIAYERIYVDTDFVPPWVFSQRLPVQRSELSIIAPAEIKIEVRTGVGNKPNESQPLRRKTEDGRERLVFVQTNLMPVFFEPDAPHPARIAPWAIPVVTAIDGQKTHSATWEGVRSKIEDLFAAVGAGAGGSGSPEGRYAHVRDALHGVDRPGLATEELAVSRPRAAQDLMDGAPACTRDAAAVLMDALAGSQLPAYPALLTGPVGPPLIEGFPGLYPFVRAVVAVDVSSRNAADPSCTEDPESRGLLCAVPQESYAFVDPLCRFCRFGELPSAFAGGRALVFLPDKARWVDIPVDSAERNHTITEFRYAFEVDGRMHGNMAGQVTGAKARTMRGELPEDGNPERLKEIMRDAFVGETVDLSFAKVGISNPFSADKPLAVSGQVETQAQKEDDELYTTRVVDFAGPVLADRFRSLRRYDALLDAPALVDAHVEIELPVSYAVGEPLPEVRLETDFAAYASGFAVQDRKLAYSRRLILKQHQLDAETYEQFRDFLDEIATAEGAAIRIGLVDEPPPEPPPEPVKKKKSKGRRGR